MTQNLYISAQKVLQETKKGTGVATPVSLQAQYWFERNAINMLSSA